MIERPNTVAGLLAKRDELVKLRKQLEADLRKVTCDIDHLDAAVRGLERQTPRVVRHPGRSDGTRDIRRPQGSGANGRVCLRSGDNINPNASSCKDAPLVRERQVIYVVFIETYQRLRFGRVEIVRAHWRSLPWR